MAKLVGGELSSQPVFALSDDDLLRIEAAGARALLADARNRLQRIARHVVERREMERADVGAALNRFSRLIRLTRNASPEDFLEALAEPDGDNDDVAGRLVAAVIAAELGHEWRSALRSIADGRDVPVECLRSWQNIWQPLSSARDVFEGAHEGRRDGDLRGHDLGWAVIELAVVFHHIGGSVRATRGHRTVRDRVQTDELREAPFSRYLRAFFESLPAGSSPIPQDLGSLVSRLKGEIEAAVAGEQRR